MKKCFLTITALFMAIALAFTGCGQQGEQNAGATGSEGQNEIVENGEVNEGEVATEPESPDAIEDEASNHQPEMRDGYYVYEVDGVELLCKTNIWDYIDGDVWQRTEMFEDLGYMRDDSIRVASRSPGFFRYVDDWRLTAFVGAPTDEYSEDFLELRYLNKLNIVSGYGESITVIVRCEQENFATDEADGPRTPIDIIITTAYFLEQCQEDVSRWYINDVFPNAKSSILRIYE